MAWSAWAAALQGVELPRVMAGDIMLLLLQAAMRGERKPGEEFSPLGLLPPAYCFRMFSEPDAEDSPSSILPRSLSPSPPKQVARNWF